MIVKSKRPEDDDALLRQLGAFVREERAAPEPDDAVPRFEDALAARITAGILAAEPSSRAASSTIEPTATRAVESSNERVAPASRPTVVAIGSRMRWAALPLAAAAALAIWIGRPAAETMPGYELSVVSAKTARSDPTSPTSDTTLDPRGDFEMIARPAVPTVGIKARAMLVRDGVARPWAPSMDISQEGAVRIVGQTKSLFPEPRGSYEIVLFVTRAALPGDSDATRVAGTPSSPELSGVRTIRARVRFATAADP